MDRTAYKSSAAPSGTKWYYMDGGKKCGPVDESIIINKLSSGALDPDTRVWTKGMDKWASASETDLVNRADESRQAPIVMSLNSAEQPAPKKKSRWWIWLIVGILVVAGAAAACFFLFFNKPKEETPEAPVAPVITYGLEEALIFENEQCAFYIDDVDEKGDYLELDVRCVNKIERPLAFVWNCTSVNGSMFDPLWDAMVMGNSTMKSSITFPLSTLDSCNLLPADEIKFILRVYDEFGSDALREESDRYIVRVPENYNKKQYKDYKEVKGYEGYLFTKDVKVDKDGRPYYVKEDKENKEKKENIYFDEIYDLNGAPRYPVTSEYNSYTGLYNDEFGRPYYFTKTGNIIYYNGCGFAFSDPETGKNYFYDETGKPAYYGNDGIPEYYEGEVPQDLAEAGMPHALEKAVGFNIVHKEFVIYPTGKSAEEVTYPGRISAISEQTYWNGEKGCFVVLGGTMDEFKGYIVHTYIENRSDSYILFGWSGAMVNGVVADPDSATVLRPHSSCYRDIIIPTALLKENKIKEVKEIDFRVFAVGENLSVPLYPIAWEAKTIAGVTD